MQRSTAPHSTISDRPFEVLICSTPVEGHVNPATAIAHALVQRGHHVRWYTGAAFRQTVEATGATFEPIVYATEPTTAILDDRFPGRAGLDGLAGLKFDLEHLFISEAPGQVRDVQRILAAAPADVLLVDTAFVAASLVHELGGPPFATYGISILPIPSRDLPPLGSGRLPSTSPVTRRLDRLVTPIATRVLFRDVQRRFQQARRSVGLPADHSTVFDTFVSPLLYLHGSAASFEYPRSDLPGHVHFVGPLVPASTPDQPFPDWWTTIDHDKPLVLVTQGTVAVDLGDLVAPTLAALAGDDVVVVATGGRGRDALTGPVPANAHVESYIPFASILPHVDVMVTNGGFGGVQLALAHGVPMVVAGTTEDKPEISARVEWSGTGINLRTKRPTPLQLRNAVWSVLSDERYRTAAERLA
ncbi:MAG TPA: nucleotide disphospho-sugar-binding domain-containing protein, partial [Ilumatobacteraceae bacterium]|nr:nucleotide disphospho-sugar-binding domain-containing protein [Ilumatobacteraceae bacterium]